MWAGLSCFKIKCTWCFGIVVFQEFGLENHWTFGAVESETRLCGSTCYE